MTFLETLNMFIQQCEGDLEDLSWQIREETNYEDNSIDWLSEEWDTVSEHLENLKKIKSIVENLK